MKITRYYDDIHIDKDTDTDWRAAQYFITITITITIMTTTIMTTTTIIINRIIPSKVFNCPSSSFVINQIQPSPPPFFVFLLWKLISFNFGSIYSYPPFLSPSSLLQLIVECRSPKAQEGNYRRLDLCHQRGFWVLWLLNVHDQMLGEEYISHLYILLWCLLLAFMKE